MNVVRIKQKELRNSHINTVYLPIYWNEVSIVYLTTTQGIICVLDTGNNCNETTLLAAPANKKNRHFSSDTGVLGPTQPCCPLLLSCCRFTVLWGRAALSSHSVRKKTRWSLLLHSAVCLTLSLVSFSPMERGISALWGWKNRADRGCGCWGLFSYGSWIWFTQLAGL